MGGRDIVLTLMRRAEQMLRDAQNDIEEGFPDLALFHVEQALQLALKALLAARAGAYPREHRLRRLLALVYEATGDEYYDSLLNERRSILRLLETAYTEARYGGEQFDQEDALEALELGREVLERVKNTLGQP